MTLGHGIEEKPRKQQAGIAERGRRPRHEDRTGSGQDTSGLIAEPARAPLITTKHIVKRCYAMRRNNEIYENVCPRRGLLMTPTRFCSVLPSLQWLRQPWPGSRHASSPPRRRACPSLSCQRASSVVAASHGAGHQARPAQSPISERARRAKPTQARRREATQSTHSPGAPANGGRAHAGPSSASRSRPWQSSTRCRWPR